MRERGEYDYKLNRALRFIREERKSYRNVQTLLDAAMRRMLIEDYKVTDAGFVQLKVGGKWHNTLIRLDG